MLEQERLCSSDMCVQFVSHDQLVIGKDRAFRFDWVFSPDTSLVIKGGVYVVQYNLHTVVTLDQHRCLCYRGPFILYTIALHSFQTDLSYLQTHPGTKKVQKNFPWYPTWWP